MAASANRSSSSSLLATASARSFTANHARHLSRSQRCLSVILLVIQSVSLSVIHLRQDHLTRSKHLQTRANRARVAGATQ